jgi:hypothetical protein
MFIIICPTLLSYFDYVELDSSYYVKLILHYFPHLTTIFTITFNVLNGKIIPLNIRCNAVQALRQ